VDQRELNSDEFRAALAFTLFLSLTLLGLGGIFWPVIMPLGFAFFIGFVLRPLVKKMDRAGLPRVLSVLLLMGALTFCISTAVVKVLPFLYREFLAVLHLVPTALLVVEEEWLPAIAEFSARSGLIDAETVRKALNRFAIFIQVAPQLKLAALKLWDSAYSLLSGVINLGLVPVLTFFVLKDYELGRRFMVRMLPQNFSPRIEMVAREISKTLRVVIAGQMKVAGILAVMYAIGFSVIGVPDGVALGIISGMCRVVPYMDALVGAFLTTTVTLSKSLSMQKVIGPMMVIAIVQLIDGMIITPRVMGKRIGIHPAVIICAMIAFGSHFGFFGILLAMPIIAVFRTVVVALAPLYRHYFTGARNSSELLFAEPQERLIVLRQLQRRRNRSRNARREVTD
jgi:predicted PurR-regulated permease PerM